MRRAEVIEKKLIYHLQRNVNESNLKSQSQTRLQIHDTPC